MSDIRSFFTPSNKRPARAVSPSSPSSDDDQPQPAKRARPSETTETPTPSHPNDIATYVGKKLTDTEKYNLLKNPSYFDPPANHVYKKSNFGKTTRSFRENWMTTYDGLCYSPSLSGAFCKYCVLFSSGRAKVGGLVEAPFTNWKKATIKFDEHFKNVRHNSGDASADTHKKTGTGHQHHQMCATMCKDFMSVMDGKQNAVNVHIDNALEQRKKDNMRVLETVVKTVILCGQQNCALRGHRDDEKHEATSENSGNFRAFLQYRADGGDTVLKKHLETAPRNATYKSKTVQNELIDIIGDDITSKIVDEIKDAGGFFSLSADEVRDVSNTEQLAVTLRFVDTSDTLREDFIAFIDVSEGTTGELLSDALLTLVDKIGLDPTKIRSQCYDGAGNMSGQTKGVAARIQKDYPKALPFWCTAHQLNRCVVQSCTIPAVRNMMSDSDEVVKFFAWSPAKELALNSKIPVEEKKKLKGLCQTRWVERHVSMDTFVKLLPYIVLTLEDYAKLPNTRKPGVASASSLVKTITSFDFIVTLFVVRGCLGYVKDISRTLQERTLDVGRAYRQVELVKESLKESRSEIDEFHDGLYKLAQDMAERLGVAEEKPRTCGRQTKRNNVPADTTTDYFKKSVTIPFLDHLITEMDTRFTCLHERATMGLKLVPSVMLDRPKVQDLEYFHDDVDVSNLTPELHQWHVMWKTRDDKPSTIIDAMKKCDADYFPNVKTILRISGAFPVTSCECERSISVLRLLKTYLRSTMGQERLTGLALMYIHRSITIKPKEIVAEYARRQPRRILLPDIMTDV